MKFITTLFSLLLTTSLCFGQRLQTPSLSPFSKASQKIGLTEVSLEYSRPSAKGRNIFGELVPYNKIWRTGANASTKITLTESAYIGDKPIEAGTYAIYTIPGEENWIIIIHSNTKLRSLAGDAYDSADDVFRFDVRPAQVSDYVETFTIQFSDLTTNSCYLQLSWENTKINIPIRVEVDEHIMTQIAGFITNSESTPHRSFFEAAQYYLNNNKDLDEAMSLINTALEKSNQNFRYGLLKAKIHDKAGDHRSALKTVTEAHLWAKEANNANYIEQTDIFRKTLLSKLD